MSTIHESPVIRPANAADRPAVERLLADERFRLLYYLSRRQRGGFQISADCAAAGRYLRLAVQRSTGTIVGLARAQNGRLDYCVSPDFWGQGIGTQLAAIVCQLVFQHAGIRRLEAIVYRENEPSRRILERLGFQFIGLRYGPAGDGRLPILCYQLNRDGLLSD